MSGATRRDLPVANNQVRRSVVGRVVVSTVDMGLLSGALAEMLGYRYESMVFPCDESGEVTDYGDLACIRSNSRSGAEVGHEALCAEWAAPEKQAEVPQ